MIDSLNESFDASSTRQMAERLDDNPSPPRSDFAEEAQASEPTLVGEMLLFLKQSKKWWLLPILIVLMIFGLLALATGTGAAPFIYTLF